MADVVQAGVTIKFYLMAFISVRPITIV